MRPAAHTRTPLAAVLMNFLRLSLRSRRAAVRSTTAEARRQVAEWRLTCPCLAACRLAMLVVCLGSLAAIAVVTAALRALPGVSPNDGRPGVAPGRAGAAHVGAAANRHPRLRPGDADVQLLLPSSGWHVHDRRPQHWIALLAFLVVAVVASNLSAAAQDRAREAIARGNEVARLFDLTRDVLLTTETAKRDGRAGPPRGAPLRAVQGGHLPACRRGWRDSPGRRRATSRIDTGTLNTALAKARGTLEFDAISAPTAATCASATRRRRDDRSAAAWHAGGRPARGGRADTRCRRPGRRCRRRRHCHRARAVPGRARRRRARSAEGRPGGDTAGLAEPRSQDAADRDQGRRREPARRSAARRSQRAGRRGDRRARPVDAAVQDILDMARIDAAAIRSTASGWPRPMWSTPPSRTSGTRSRATLARGRRRRHRGGDRSAPRVGRPLALARERGAVFTADREILVQARVEADGLHVAVTDTGPDSTRASSIIFRAFLPRPRRPAGSSGTGMGLSITRGLLAAAGGRVWAENVPGAGARFTIVVPGRHRVRRRWRSRHGCAHPHRRRRTQHHRHGGSAAAGARVRGLVRMARPRGAGRRGARRTRPHRARSRPAGHRRR